MEQQPRWAEMCARILQQCVALQGGRRPLCEYLGAKPQELDAWLAARSGPPRAIFERAMEIILKEHDRRAALEAQNPPPKRRRADLAHP
ncbi:MAG TPA: hypothetical protein VFB08_16935 [Burkholderiales bacterium]|nr:hypothetical protein [Burkholderiales bacterium]